MEQFTFSEDCGIAPIVLFQGSYSNYRNRFSQGNMRIDNLPKQQDFALQVSWWCL